MTWIDQIIVLFSQILTIIIFSSICAYILKALGQTRVIGEMIAGILLGPSVFGLFFPDIFNMIFPAGSMPSLRLLSQVGLLFFMFVVGLELKISNLKNRISAAVIISHVSIVFPFILGAVISLSIYKKYGPTGFTFSSFALFMGIAMSITAFPVLARIIQERKLSNTSLGAMAITCAAIDDVTAWCVLAAIISIVQAEAGQSIFAIIGLVLIYILLMFKVIKPMLQKSLQLNVKNNFSFYQYVLILIVLLTSAWIAEYIGIHALFGAFLAGAIMPASLEHRSFKLKKIEKLNAIVLLPLFFAYTGLRMQLGLLNNQEAWFYCILIIVVAIIGKMLGSALAARWTGMSWSDSWALGTLMNTRGLMELVVLNIGYDLGILSATVFTMMAIMAVVTTAMTGPLLTFFLRKEIKA